MRSEFLIVDDKLKLSIPNQIYGDQLFSIIDSERNHLSQWLNFVDKINSKNDAKVFLQQLLLNNRTKKSFHTLVLYDNQLIGGVGFVKIDSLDKKATLGYWISENFQGKGFASKFCRRIIDYGFKFLNIALIEIEIKKENKRSIALSKKIGFERQSNQNNVDLVEIFGLKKSTYTRA